MKRRLYFIAIVTLGIQTLRGDAQENVLVAEPARNALLETVEIHAVAKGLLGHGEKNAAALDDSIANLHHFNLWVDGLVSQDLKFADSISLLLEWDFYRHGRHNNEIGDAYLQVDGIGHANWLNARVGRFQIPFGEEYLWASAGEYNNPMGRGTVAFPYGWDEGIQVFGTLNTAMDFRYVAHATDGDDAFNGDGEGHGQFGLKLSAQPVTPVYVSASALDVDKSGTERAPAKSAMEWGGTHAYPVDGNTLDGMQAWELDTKLIPIEGVSFWGAYGEVSIDDGVTAENDRDLEYQIAQLIIQPGNCEDAPSWTQDLYVAARYSEISSATPGKGYFLIGLNTPASFGFDTHKISAWQWALGYALSDNTKLVLEYDQYDYELLPGTPGQTGDRDMIYLEWVGRY
jgi:hypothetical protein